MADNEREDSATKADDSEENPEPRPPAKKTPEPTTSAPAPGDDIIIK
jgi:hypothetical protein